MKKALLILVSLILSMSVQSISQTTTGFLEDFNAPVDLNFWTPNKTTHDDGTPVFNISQEDGARLRCDSKEHLGDLGDLF
jgi:hypothetical protein